MTNWHVADRLSAYLANELEVEERNFIESHLEICYACRQEFDLLREIDMLLDDLPLEDPGPDFANSVMEQVRTQVRVEEGDLSGRSLKTRRPSFWKGSDFRNMAASVVAAFVLFQGFVEIVPKVAEIDGTISAYAAVTKVKLEIWMQTITQSLGG